VGVTQIICKNLAFMSSFAYELAWLRWRTISMTALVCSPMIVQVDTATSDSRA
jgi:hypothetical protein